VQLNIDSQGVVADSSGIIHLHLAELFISDLTVPTPVTSIHSPRVYLHMSNRKNIYVIACGVLGPEINSLAEKLCVDLRTHYLPGRLHNAPDVLRDRLQKSIDEISSDPHCGRIIIGYGLCGRGTVAIYSRSAPLVIPKVHDCVALFLGSDQAYREQFSRYPGTYYLTEGWCDEKEKDRNRQQTVQIGSEEMESRELKRRFGKHNGQRIERFFKSWTKNYQRAVYIDTGVGNRQKSIQSAMDMAAMNGWEFAKIPGKLTLLEKLLTTNVSDGEILFVPPEYVTQYSAADDGLVCCAGSNADFQIGGHNRKKHIQGTSSDLDKKRHQRIGLGIDAGGTYTDSIIYDFLTDDVLQKNKALTTKWDFSEGIKKSLAGLDSAFFKQIELVSVSTTLATNAIVEGEGQRTGLILMGG